jgi:hypothetical protein
MVMSAGSTFVGPLEVLDDDFFEPPQALTPSVSASSSVSVSARLIPCLLDLVRIPNAIFSWLRVGSQELGILVVRS